VENEALQGRVFDILGEVFEETSLKDLLMRAIRFGDDPKPEPRCSVRSREPLTGKHIMDHLERNALPGDSQS